MTPFDDELPAIRRTVSSQRLQVVHIPSRAIGPIKEQFRRAWESARSGYDQPLPPPEEASPLAPDEPVPEVDPPETYGEHGEILHPHPTLPPAPHLDLKV
jgi:hypothetical protein